MKRFVLASILFCATQVFGQTSVITEQPQNQTASVGQTANFAIAISDPTCTVMWQRNGVNIRSGADLVSYTTPPVKLTDTGAKFGVAVYNCKKAANAHSATATLTVKSASGAPAISVQPANQTRMVGQQATFSVVAGGTAPLGYQWHKNGTAISGATASNYTTPPTTTSDSGSTFQVVVSNVGGNTASTAATLTVNSSTTPPTVSITSPQANATVSGTITVTASASDSVGVASVQLQIDGANVGAADTSAPYSFSFDTAAVSNGSHSLTAVAKDTQGNQATSAAVSITVSNPAGGAEPTYANNGAGCPITTVAGGPSNAVTQYNCPLPNATGSGNLLVVWVRYLAQSGENVSFTDNIGGNTYVQAASCNDSTAPNTQASLYYVENVTAGVNVVHAHFSVSTDRVQMQVYEFYNVAVSALDAAVCTSGTGTAISPGTLAPSASGDLVVEFGHGKNSTAISSCSVGSQSNISWTMRASVIASSEPMCAQYGVYNSTAAFAPSMTFSKSVRFMALAAAFKPAAAGTAPPTGIRVAYVQHDNGGSLNNTSWTAQIPMSGNLGVYVFISACGTNAFNSCNYAQSVSDGRNAWTLLGSTFMTNTGSSQEESAQIWYAKNATAGLYSFSAVTNPAGSIEAAFPQTWIFYDIAGASSNPVDTGFGGAGTGLATFDSINSSGPITTFTVTPTGQNEVVLVGAGYEFNNMTGMTSPANGQFVAATYDRGVNETWVDANGGYALLYNGSSTAPETWTWTHDTVNGSGSGRGLAIGAAFQPGP